MTNITKKEISDYFFNQSDPETSKKVENWFLVHGRSQEAHDILYSLWNEIEITTDEQSLLETKEAFARFCDRLSDSETPKAVHQTVKLKKFSRITWIYRAAVIVLLPLLIFSVVKIVELDRNADVEWVEKYIACGDDEEIILPDGTTVHMNSDSRIFYPEKFIGRNRQVHFSGEGYFNVAKNASSPFEIRTDGSVVQVHGTEFNLKSYPDESQIEIFLFDGSVSFKESVNNTLPVFLEPGEKIIYDKSSRTVKKSRFDIDSYTSWEEGEFYFKDCPLEDIVRQLERHFDKRIVISTDSLKTMPFYMAFVNNESLEDILKVLSSNESMHVKNRGSYIEIY